MSARKRNSPPIIHRGMARVWSNHRPVVSEIETRIRANDALYRMQLAYKRDFSVSLSLRVFTCYCFRCMKVKFLHFCNYARAEENNN